MTDNLIRNYNTLRKDISHQIKFMDDYDIFDFNYMIDTLKKMQMIQKKLKKIESKSNKN